MDQKSVAYLVNRYPGTSHSFIRREVQALERLGWRVLRYSVRDCRDELVDQRDIDEHARTTAILSQRVWQIGWALFACLRQPSRFLAMLCETWHCGVAANQRIRHFAYLLEAAWLARSLRHAGVRHIHAHFGTNSSTVAMLAAGLMEGGTFSFTVHGPEEFDRPEAWSLPRKLERCRFAVAVSSFGRSQLYRWCPWDAWSKVQVVHCGLEAEHFIAAPPKAESRLLVCLGRLCEQKGQLLLVEAADRLKRSGEQFTLVFVGDGPMRGVLEQRVRQFDMQDEVRFVGWQTGSQVMDWLHECRAMVLPSFAEGLPVAIMEAMALGRPAITTFIAGIPELVNRDCGWLVPAGSVPDLVTAIRECLECPPETLAGMGQVAADRVRIDHDIHREAGRLSQLLAGAT
jgi:glycosyltransferase involved in cell wall biosynthesis